MEILSCGDSVLLKLDSAETWPSGDSVLRKLGFMKFRPRGKSACLSEGLTPSQRSSDSKGAIIMSKRRSCKVKEEQTSSQRDETAKSKKSNRQVKEAKLQSQRRAFAFSRMSLPKKESPVLRIGGFVFNSTAFRDILRGRSYRILPLQPSPCPRGMSFRAILRLFHKPVLAFCRFLSLNL